MAIFLRSRLVRTLSAVILFLRNSITPESNVRFESQGVDLMRSGEGRLRAESSLPLKSAHSFIMPTGSFETPNKSLS